MVAKVRGKRYITPLAIALVEFLQKDYYGSLCVA